ncbi:MAG: ABC transporter permease [Clostridiales bacterium GWF2_38_85]|nr:MAG: ABC transporter permease [Clostridiales bacterium GWF2_38_85]HBL84760.1 ABC transporter permease [Clostridiales bacterium]
MDKDHNLKNENQTNADEVELNQVILSPGQLVFKRFLRNKLAVIGIAVLLFMIIFSFIGPFFTTYRETTIFYSVERIDEQTGEELLYEIPGTELSTVSKQYKNAHVIQNVKTPPNSYHILGTDNMGRDILTRLMYGGRVSLLIGLCVVIVELLIGVTLGGIAGYYGGVADMIIMRMVEIFYAIPFIPLMLIISAIMIQFNISPGTKIYYIMLIMGVIYWAGVARMIRGQILSLREMEYMQAAEATGIRPIKRIFKHLIPNVMPIIIVMATMDLGGVILTESTMSYLGVGVPATQASWGNMVSTVQGMTNLFHYWFMWIPPGMCILFTVLAFNFAGDGLRDAFDPKMKR